MQNPLQLVQTLAVWALPVLFAITLHEVAHGWVARALGDDTAARLGRLSLNPLKHVDPVGTVLVPAIMLLVAGFGFGWAKPVPVVASKFRNPRRDMALVAAAGPVSNFAMALAWGLLLKLAVAQDRDSLQWEIVQRMSSAGIVINLVLMVLNFLPLPPLDGSRVLRWLLPERGARALDRIEPYGMLILVLLLSTKVLGTVMQPLLEVSQSVLIALLHLEGS
jgi:Zn-dependent protease